MQVLGVGAKAGAGGFGMRRRDSTTIFEQTPTTICCGLFTLRVGVRIASTLTIAEGLCQLYVHLADVFSGEPVFRWGPERYEQQLQAASALTGAVAIFCGLLGWRSTWTCRPIHARVFRRIQGCLMLWAVLWFLFVGVPVKVEHVDVPLFEELPLSLLPGQPTRPVIDPEWPSGKPTVCQDIADIKGRLVQSLNKNMKHRFLRTGLRRLYTVLLKNVLTCKQTVRLFWGWCAALLVLRGYCIYVAGFFLKVVLRGGDGVMMIGPLADLDKPFTETTSSLLLIREQVRTAFEQMDTDGDGRLSLEELIQYLEGSSHRYKGLSSCPEPDSRAKAL